MKNFLLARRIFFATVAAWLWMFPCGAQSLAADEFIATLRPSLTFFASFDNGLDADFASGDPKLYTAASMKHPRTGQPGLPPGGVVTREADKGRFGGALRFHKKGPHAVFFSGKGNMPYRARDWSGTVSFWLKVDPARELEPGYCDPIQITPREWNDAAFFVEFEKRTTSIPFRLGAYADFKVWNPQNREWASIPAHEKPLLTVEQPPFAGDRWTHVAFAFANFNTGRADGVATLYLNGKPQGTMAAREQTFTWDPEKVLVMLGLSYIGWWDELAIFNRALTEGEVAQLYRLEKGLSATK